MMASPATTTPSQRASDAAGADAPLFLPGGGGVFPRLYQQVAVSGLGTVFYTPGGVGGWALDLVLRVYLAYARRIAATKARRGARAYFARAPRTVQV